MSPEQTGSQGPLGKRTELYGWGRTARSAAALVACHTPDDVTSALASPPPRGLIPRGLGRSYGDVAQCAGGAVLDMSTLTGVLDADLDSGVVRARAGTSLDTLMRLFVPLGYFVPVTAGTRHVTVGGAIAADIHGKNHHVDGSFTRHVLSLTLATPVGTLTVTPDGDPELFWATAGGMGLTGVILDATMALTHVETSSMIVDTERARDIDDLMAMMDGGDARYRYSVAWIDCQARGRHLGRAVLTRGDHARRDDLPRRRQPARRCLPARRLSAAPGASPAAGSEAGSDERALAFSPTVRLHAPAVAPANLLNRWTISSFNEVWYRKAPHRRTGQIESITSFFHPLDAVGGWNRLYGRPGFVQYQMVVPFGAEDTLRETVQCLASSRAASFLAVLKRFGAGGPGALSFPIAGWTLALDIPAGDPGLGPLLDSLDDRVVGCGGRVYLAKDARARPEVMRAMYPRINELEAVRSRVDPRGVLRSDMAARLGLVPRPGVVSGSTLTRP